MKLLWMPAWTAWMQRTTERLHSASAVETVVFQEPFGGSMTPGGSGPKVSAARTVDLDLDKLADQLKPLAYGKRLALLQYLTQPHYLEEIASHLGMARQAAQKHVDKLLAIDVIEKQQGQRETGPVIEYKVVPSALFALNEKFSKLGVLQPAAEERALARTMVGTGQPTEEDLAAGPRLTLVHGMLQGEALRLSPGEGPWTLGRDLDRDLCLDYDPFVSNRHAEIVREEAGFTLVDTYSTNGTTLNFERLERGAHEPLTPGDIVGVGKSLLVFQA